MEINSPKTVLKQVRLFEVRFKHGDPPFDTVVLDENDTYDEGETKIVIRAGRKRFVYYVDALAAISMDEVAAEVRVEAPIVRPGTKQIQ